VRCLPADKAGTFVRLEKFLVEARFGCTLVEAIEDRYKDGLSATEGAGPGKDEDLYVTTVGRRQLRVSLVGQAKILEKLANLGQLTHAVMMGASIATMVCHTKTLTSLPLL
jgi:hypothetical protein